MFVGGPDVEHHGVFLLPELVKFLGSDIANAGFLGGDGRFGVVSDNGGDEQERGGNGEDFHGG